LEIFGFTVRKNVFDAALKRCSLTIIFLSHFDSENVYQGKIERVFFQEKQNVHITAGIFYIKLQNFAFYEFEASGVLLSNHPPSPFPITPLLFAKRKMFFGFFSC